MSLIRFQQRFFLLIFIFRKFLYHLFIFLYTFLLYIFYKNLKLYIYFLLDHFFVKTAFIRE